MPKQGKTTKKFPGFRKPTYTMVPDELFDELLADLTGSELKVLLYITRRTFGFKKESDNISLNQMLSGIRTKDGRILDRGTGLAKSTLVSALKSLVAKNIVMAEKRKSARRGYQPTNYRLNIITPSSKIEQALSENSTKPLGKNRTYNKQLYKIQITTIMLLLS